jgi:putative ABC transport system ATP-binding protein
MIEVKDLHKYYGHGPNAVHALRSINMAVRTGEFVAIMGRSGSGKSTMLHILGLLDQPSSGEVWVDKVEVLKLSEPERARFRLERLGYVFQEYSLIPELTLLENVFLPGLCHEGGDRDFRRRAAEILETVGLLSRLNHYPNEASGGEQQRVAIARALINRPSILYADEPTANLDAVSAETVLQLFRRLNREMKLTIVMVTHEPEDEKYVDRVIRLSDGALDTGDGFR